VEQSQRPIRVLVVDDHPLLRAGIASAVETQPDMCVVGHADDGIDAIEQFRQLRPDVTLMDLQMPRMGGIEAIKVICREFPSAVILVLTTYKGDVQAHRALAAGAMGFLLKDMLRKELVEAIRGVNKGELVISPEVQIEMAKHSENDVLTERETAIIKQVSLGHSNKLVAIHLCITPETVKAHIRNILAKLGAHDRIHAVDIARRRGIIDS